MYRVYYYTIPYSIVDSGPRCPLHKRTNASGHLAARCLCCFGVNTGCKSIRVASAAPSPRVQAHVFSNMCFLHFIPPTGHPPCNSD